MPRSCVEFGGSRIIQDPWLFGTAFNDGWSLLCDYGFDPERFADIDYIWISHEHPDHFSPAVLRSVPEAVRRDITVLFQQTKDRKILDFCTEIGYKTRELPHMEPDRHWTTASKWSAARFRCTTRGSSTTAAGSRS